MKRTLFVLLAAAALPSVAAAQSPAEEIARAVLAAPANMRAEATVLKLQPDGQTTVLRQVSNGLICWDNRGRAGYDNAIDVQCTTEANRARLEQNHAVQAEGGSEDEVNARFARLDQQGTRAKSVFGSIYYHVMGADMNSLRTHTTVAVPNATGAQLGLPEARAAGMLWLMEAGSSSAHLMVSGM